MQKPAPPILEDLTPQDVVFSRVPAEGMRMEVGADGEMSVRHEVLVKDLYVRKPFVAMPINDGIVERASGPDAQSYIRLPVARSATGFATSMDWALAALAAPPAKASDADTAARAQNIIAAFKSGALCARHFLVKHPHTYRTAWQMLMESGVADSQILSMVNAAGGKPAWHLLADAPETLDLAIQAYRPVVSERLWDAGARHVSPPGMFRAAAPYIDRIMENLGSQASAASIQGWSRPRATGWKGMAPEEVLARWGDTWRPRVLAMVADMETTPQSMVSNPDRKTMDTWSLPAWVACYSGLPALFSRNFSASPSQIASLRTVASAQRLAWLEGLLALGCDLPEQVPVPSWAEGHPPGRVSLEALLTQAISGTQFSPEERAGILGILQRHTLAAAKPPAKPRRHA